MAFYTDIRFACVLTILIYCFLEFVNIFAIEKLIVQVLIIIVAL